MQFFVKVLLSVVAVFLILLILVQRGRGGGLAGAFGGMGGSSAFGAKAGDVFTKITIVAAGIWIVLCIVATNLTPERESKLDAGGIGASSTPPADAGPGLGAPASEDDEASDEIDFKSDTFSEEALEEGLEDQPASGEETDEPADSPAEDES